MSFIETTIAEFGPISLAEMDSVALMNRIDTKYLMSKSDAVSALEHLENDYQVLQIGGKRTFQYRTVYFDTQDRLLLQEHLRGKLNREKVRSREYVGTDSRFFELKLKTNKGRTVKSRMPKQGEMTTIAPQEAAFLSSRSQLDTTQLGPVMEVSFKRSTLVSTEFKERITFDFQLGFTCGPHQKTVTDLVIVEVKRDSEGGLRTPVMQTLKALSIRPSAMSKYCLGMVLLHETTRYNNYKPKLRKLNKLSTHGNIW